MLILKLCHFKNKILQGLLIFCFLFTGCGYRWGAGGEFSPYSTISIPYVEGDWDGNLTSHIIKEMSRSGNLQVVNSGGSLILKVYIVDIWEDDVGFRYDRKKDGKIRKSIVPDETRLAISADIYLIESLSGNILLGPVRVISETEFDHDYYSSQCGINVFSLGQFTDIDEARDAAEKPLNRRLAEKIVSYINDYW